MSFQSFRKAASVKCLSQSRQNVVNTSQTGHINIGGDFIPSISTIMLRFASRLGRIDVSAIVLNQYEPDAVCRRFGSGE